MRYAAINIQMLSIKMPGPSEEFPGHFIIFDPEILFGQFKADVYARNSIGGVDFPPSARAITSIVNPSAVGGSTARFDNSGARTGIVLPHPNITSLVLIGNFAIGSRFVLYKLEEN